MLRICLILSLLTVNILGIDLKDIFNKKPTVVYTPGSGCCNPGTTAFPTSTSPTVTVAPTTVTTQGGDQSCKTDENQDGFCVKPELCDNKPAAPNGPPGFIYTKRRDSDRECPGSLICCSFGVGPTTKPTTAPTNTPIVFPDVAVKEGCGWRYEDGIGARDGEDIAAFGEFNWVLPIFKIEGGAEKYVSVGSLIHPRMVLTYASKFMRRGSFVVKAGDHDLLSTDEIYDHQTVEVERVVRHKDFNSGSMKNNIAILILKQEVKPARHIGYACLPDASTRPAVGADCVAIGWGADTEVNGTIRNTPKLVTLPIVDHAVCQESLRPFTKPTFNLHPSNLCAGGLKDVDLCKGDGGAPLMCLYPGQTTRYYQAGIFSWGLFCGRESVPSMYTDVTELRSWIDTTIAAERFDSKTFTP